MAADILVVDDEVDIREQVAGILEDEGYSVRTAQDSESALASVGARKPALLILDRPPALRGPPLAWCSTLPFAKGAEEGIRVFVSE